MICVYGIKNCNTMKKCFEYLSAHQVAYEFFDYKKSQLSRSQFDTFVDNFGLDKLINKQGTTYRQLDDEKKAQVLAGNMDEIYATVISNQSLLKRPIVMGEWAGQTLALIGFNLADYEALFGLSAQSIKD